MGDWVIGTGSANSWIAKEEKVDLSGHLVYAMKVSGKMTLQQYEEHCERKLQNKIPIGKTKDWRLRMGDCIYYDFAKREKPAMRKSVHNETNRQRDLSGVNALLSTEFYYFGLAAKELQGDLKRLVKRNQGHLVIEQPELIQRFNEWIGQFEKNKLYADPQLRWKFDREVAEDEIGQCARQDYEDDEDETCEHLC